MPVGLTSPRAAGGRVGPVMRCTTLKASAQRLGAVLAYYAGLAGDRSASVGPARGPVDLYLDPDEPTGCCWVRGRSALGLSGEVVVEDLRALLDGRHPVDEC